MKSMRLSVANKAMGLKEVSFVADRGSCKELMGLIDWDNESKPSLGLEM
jgi:hypothetical protein